MKDHRLQGSDSRNFLHTALQAADPGLWRPPSSNRAAALTLGPRVQTVVSLFLSDKATDSILGPHPLDIRPDSLTPIQKSARINSRKEESFDAPVANFKGTTGPKFDLPEA